MAKRKSPHPFQGRWLIEHMDQWDVQKESEELQPFFEFEKADIGQFQFGCVYGEMDFRFGQRDGKTAVEFSWDGHEEDEQVFGRGWAMIDDDNMTGMIFFHLGDESGFIARRVKDHSPVNEITALLRKPFPARKLTWLTDAMNLMEWTDAMSKKAYPSAKITVPPYGPTTLVSIQLTAEELETILTSTEIDKTKRLRPRLEAMAAEGRAVELEIDEWSRVLLTLCGKQARGMSTPKDALRTAKTIANKLAEALDVDPPVLRP